MNGESHLLVVYRYFYVCTTQHHHMERYNTECIKHNKCNTQSCLKIQGTALDILLAPGCPGEVILLELDGTVAWRVQKQSFLACDKSVKLDTVTQSVAQVLRTLCACMCTVILRCHGKPGSSRPASPPAYNTKRGTLPGRSETTTTPS